MVDIPQFYYLAYIGSYKPHTWVNNSTHNSNGSMSILSIKERDMEGEWLYIYISECEQR